MMPSMKAILFVVICCHCLLLGACSPKPTISPETLALSNTANQLIIPWHQEFERRSQALYEHLERFCQNPSNQGELEASRKAWLAAMLSWQQAYVINFGPISEGNLSWRIQFWPDSHNRVGRKVDELLSKDEPITSQSLAESVVLVQGLSALEYVLFDPQASAIAKFQNPKACEFLLAASTNTHNVAALLLRRWQPDGDNFVGVFLSPGANNGSFATDSEAIAAIVSAIVSSLEQIKGKKIAEPMGNPPTLLKINPYKLEHWRSGGSLAAMQQDLSSVRSLFDIAIKPLLIEQQQSALAEDVSERLAKIEEELQQQKSPLFKTLRDPQHLPNWSALWNELGAVLGPIKRDVPNALKLKLGFNSNDGD